MLSRIVTLMDNHSSVGASRTVGISPARALTTTASEGPHYITSAVSPRQLTIGTDCSGLEAPIQALKNLKVKHDHVFSSDIDPSAIKFIKENFKPKTMFHDVTTRDPEEAAHVDIYVAGFPCQPFSVGGKKQGFDDAKNRGKVVFHLMEYIRIQKPKVFVLENVKGFVTLAKGEYVRTIVKALKAIRGHDESGTTNGLYNVYHTTLNTKDHGVPQNRPRWFCVGILKTLDKDNNFDFPVNIACAPLESVLEETSENGSRRTSKSEPQCVVKNVERAETQIKAAGHNPQKQVFAVDCDASPARMTWQQHHSPCLTRSRYRGHWLTKLNRRMTIQEMFRLQGMDSSQLKLNCNEATQ